MHEVTGMVTFDGQPVPQGEVIFLPTDGQGQPAGGRIADGKYTLKTLAGNKRVEIRADREHATATIDGIEPGTTAPLREQYIPERYNTESELNAEVSETGNNSFDFALEP